MSRSNARRPLGHFPLPNTQLAYLLRWRRGARAGHHVDVSYSIASDVRPRAIMLAFAIRSRKDVGIAPVEVCACSLRANAGVTRHDPPTHTTMGKHVMQIRAFQAGVVCGSVPRRPVWPANPCPRGRYRLQICAGEAGIAY